MQMRLKDILNGRRFSKIASELSSRYDLHLESVNPCGRTIYHLSDSSCHPEFCGIIRDSRPALKRCYLNHMEWIKFSQNSGKPYIGICHAGVVLGCAAIVYRKQILGGLLFGKCLADKIYLLSQFELHKRFTGYRFYWNSLRRAMKQLPVIPERQIVRAGMFLQKELKAILSANKISALPKQVSQKQFDISLPQIDLSSRLRPAIDYMDYHYDLPVKLCELADLCAMSIFGFAHLFHKEAGITPVDYLTRVRIGHAMRLLVKSDWNYCQILQSVGYRNQSYFIRVFKRFTGMTPEAFRQAKKASSKSTKSAKKGI